MELVDRLEFVFPAGRRQCKTNKVEQRQMNFGALWFVKVVYLSTGFNLKFPQSNVYV